MVWGFVTFLKGLQRALYNFLFNIGSFFLGLFSLASAPKVLATFFLYQNATNNRITLDGANHELLNQNATTVAIFHGWTQNVSYPYIDQIAAAFQERAARLDISYNIICVDWSEAAKSPYYLPALLETPDVGNYVGQFFMGLQDEGRILLNNTIMVGHSMGAQVVANVGKEVRENRPLYDLIMRIDSLDAAGPGYEQNNVYQQIYSLSSSDARMVCTMHTTRLIGGLKAEGSVNFYANSGKLSQPACDVSDVYCSHHMSYVYYIEAINSNKFVGRGCTENCNGAKEMVFGIETPENASGIWYLDTNAQSPYAMG